VDRCGLKRIAENDLPFEKNLYAQVNCGVFIFEEFGKSALICRHKECIM